MRNDLIWLAAYAGCVSSVVIFLAAGGAIPLRAAIDWISSEAETASVFFVQSTTSAQIQNNYHEVSPSPAVLAKKVRILIVPGHQPSEGGTEFRDIYERDIVVDIANALVKLLTQNSRYDVIVARTKTEWNPVFQSYFDTHASDIEAFIQSQKLQMASHIADGSILPAVDQVYHNSASATGTLQLFGINKWASENKYDIILHLHLNDYAGRRTNVVGKYDGFAIYVPDRQYSNAEASKAVGEAIAVRLNAYHATSTLPKEDVGVVPDQQLIATGSNNSVDGAALLIEYGYIYEPQFLKQSMRPLAVADYAYQTYLGLQDFFGDPISSTFGSVSLPYDWSKVNTENKSSESGIYALQAALRHIGYYPPAGKSFSNCPVSGTSGACTRTAIEEYQRAHGLTTTGALGPQTRAELERDLAY